MDFAALIIACLSFFVAALALGWQMASWVMDGPRVRVSLRHGLAGRGGVVSGKVGSDGRPADVSIMRDQGWNGPAVIGVQVVNRGRARVKVTRCALVLRRGGFSVEFHEPGFGSPEFPTWIEPRDSATWWVDLTEAHALLDVARTSDAAAGGVGMSVMLGDGGEKRTPTYAEL